MKTTLLQSGKRLEASGCQMRQSVSWKVYPSSLASFPLSSFAALRSLREVLLVLAVAVTLAGVGDLVQAEETRVTPSSAESSGEAPNDPMEAFRRAIQRSQEGQPSGRQAAPPPQMGGFLEALRRGSRQAAPQVTFPVPVAMDQPNDDGSAILVEWEPFELPERIEAGLEILRNGPEGEKVVGSAPAFNGRFVDGNEVEMGVEYSYALRLDDQSAVGSFSEPAVAKAQWFNSDKIVLLILCIAFSAAILYNIQRARQGEELYIRPIAGLNAMEEAVGRATEMGRPVLYVPGIQDLDHVMTIAGVSILGSVAKTVAEYDAEILVPTARSVVMSACQNVVKEAYYEAGSADAYNPDSVYYITDDQFSYAAAVNGLMVREKPAAIFLQGHFYAESLILAETGNSVGAIQIAGTAEASQLPFFVAACDYTLLGEELFAASAYLSQEPLQLGSIKGQDYGKFLIMAAIVVSVILFNLGFEEVKALFQS